MQKVVIYPGRFQPMLAHHAEVYKQLQATYPDADVYIGTSNKVEGEKSPFNFEEKVRIASAHGIPGDKILQATRPYHKDDYDFDEKSTVIIFAVGEKDLDRFPFNNVDPETNLDMTVRGETRPKYYQPLSTFDAKNPVTMDERGYITLAPTVKTGDEVASASAFRERFKNSPDEESAKDVFVDQFGEYNDEVFNLIYDKIVRKQMSEELNTLKKLAGLNEGPAVDFDDYQTISKKDAKASAERPEKAASSDPESVDFQSPDPEKFHSTIKKSIANRMDSDDVNDSEAKKDAFMKELLKSPETLLGEINARLAVDDNGLAVSDRLSDIMNKLGPKGLAGLEEDDKKFVIKLVANALKNMELVKDPKADQEKAEYEKELEDSVDLSDIKAEYGIEEQSADQDVGADAMNTFVKYRDEVEKNYGEDGLKYYYNVWQEVKRQRGAKANAGEAYRLTVQKFSGQELTKPLDMKTLEPAESFDPSAEQRREEEAYNELFSAYDKGGEEALAKELSMSIEELDNELSEFGIEHNLHADDDRDEIIQRYIEDTVDNADWKDHGEQDFDPADAEMESIQEGAVDHPAVKKLVALAKEIQNNGYRWSESDYMDFNDAIEPILDDEELVSQIPMYPEMEEDDPKVIKAMIDKLADFDGDVQSKKITDHPVVKKLVALAKEIQDDDYRWSESDYMDFNDAIEPILDDEELVSQIPMYPEMEEDDPKVIKAMIDKLAAFGGNDQGEMDDLSKLRKLAGMESIQEGGDCHHCKGDDPDCEHCDGSGYVQFDDDPNEPDEDEIEKQLGKMLKLAGMK